CYTHVFFTCFYYVAHLSSTLATDRSTISPSHFFFHDTATTEIYTLSLHDALPISASKRASTSRCRREARSRPTGSPSQTTATSRSEEHTSELQSLAYLVCRLLLEKKKNKHSPHNRRVGRTRTQRLHHNYLAIDIES